MGRLEEYRDRYLANSPYYHIADARVPVFVLHGEGRYPGSPQMTEFFRELQRLYKPARYKAYPGENFYVSGFENTKEMLGDMQAFFDFYPAGNGHPAARRRLPGGAGGQELLRGTRASSAVAGGRAAVVWMDLYQEGLDATAATGPAVTVMNGTAVVRAARPFACREPKASHLLYPVRPTPGGLRCPTTSTATASPALTEPRPPRPLSPLHPEPLAARPRRPSP